MAEAALKPGTDMKEVTTQRQQVMDVLGSTQHHDAITGTAKQHVADDYSRRIAEVIHNNSALFSDAITDKVSQLSGKQIEDWKQCEMTNATYLNCTPMAEDVAMDKEIFVATQNPSSLDASTIEIPVPHGNYQVEGYDSSSNQFKQVDAEVLCHDDYTPNSTHVKSCFLHAKQPTNSYSVSLLKLTRKNTSIEVENDKVSSDAQLTKAGDL